jgi:preprotein translocase subunit YajC
MEHTDTVPNTEESKSSFCPIKRFFVIILFNIIFPFFYFFLYRRKKRMHAITQITQTKSKPGVLLGF